LSEKSLILKENAEYIYESLGRAVEGLTEKEAAWRPTEVSNSTEWILNHLARISNLSLPRIIKGDPDYVPDGWPSDYREMHHGLEKMLSDIEAGKKAVLEGLGKLTSTQLARRAWQADLNPARGGDPLLGWNQEAEDRSLRVSRRTRPSQGADLVSQGHDETPQGERPEIPRIGRAIFFHLFLN